jgi:drug/metabolite transporter (DMT)-like permease
VVLEYLMFGVVPSVLTAAGIVVTCLGVALVFWRRPRAKGQ